jgi:hypothetical protein
MRIIEQRYIDSHNRYSNQPCLLSILDLDGAEAASPSEVSTITARLKGMLKGLPQLDPLINTIGPVSDEGQSPSHSFKMARLIQAVTLELQRLAGSELMVGFVGALPHMPGRFRLVLPYRMGKVAAAAVKAALQLVDAVRAGVNIDIAAVVATLRARSNRRRAAILRRIKRTHRP